MDADREKRITEKGTRLHEAEKKYKESLSAAIESEDSRRKEQIIHQGKCSAEYHDAKDDFQKECAITFPLIIPPAPAHPPTPILTTVHESWWVRYRDVFWVIVVIVVAALVSASKHV